MAESTILKYANIKVTSYSGTSNSAGNFYLGPVNANGWKPVSVYETGAANRMFIPFQTGTAYYVKVLDWNNNAYTPVANGAVALDVVWVR